MIFSEGSPQNWIARRNPFNLPAPPVWFLRKLYDRDPLLAIMPGIMHNAYRLVRKSAKAVKAKQLAPNVEVQEMLLHSCVPVTTIAPFTNWGLQIFQWLDDHDTWKHGGADRFADKLESQEAAAQQKQDALIREEAEQRAVSGYHALLNRTGNFHIVPDVEDFFTKERAAVR
jgi:hypothetical protein